MRERTFAKTKNQKPMTVNTKVVVNLIIQVW